MQFMKKILFFFVYDFVCGESEVKGRPS